MTQKEKKEIYLKCDYEQMLQLKHFVKIFVEFANEYNDAIKKAKRAIIDLRGEDLEALCFAVDNDFWRTGNWPIERPDIGYPWPWSCLKLMEELSDIKLKNNPYLIEADDECRLNEWIKMNKKGV